MSYLPAISFYYMKGVPLAREVLTEFEKNLNRAGWVPVVSTISGGIRITYGVAEIVAGLALATFASLVFLYYQDEEFRKESFRALEFVVHGAFNVVRGFVESYRWVNLVCLLYDKFVPEHLLIRYDKPFITFRG